MTNIDTANSKLAFSFEYYDTSRPEYCLSAWDTEKIRKTLERLKDVNTKSFQQLRRERGVYHFNEVNWNKTIEKNGFSNRGLGNLPPFHFALLGVNGQLARVYGAYSSGIFYIVWFDLTHAVWPTPLKHT